MLELQRILALDVALKDTPTRQWETHKQMIYDWEQCNRLMIVHFGDVEVYRVGRYDGKNYPSSDLIKCQMLWTSWPKDEWVHNFFHTLEEMPRSWYVAVELCRTITTWEELSVYFVKTFNF